MIVNMKAVLLWTGMVVLSCTAFGETLPEITKMSGPERRCRVNLCFAIDGSDNIAPFQFRIERNFIRRVVRRISRENNINVAAVQYGLFNRAISILTADVEKFIEDLEDTTFVDSTRSSVGSGIVWCHRQLSESRRAKLVVMGAGESDLGGSPDLRARLFRSDTNGEVFAVGIGDTDTDTLRGITGNSRNVFHLRRRSDIVDVAQDLIAEICD